MLALLTITRASIGARLVIGNKLSQSQCSGKALVAQLVAQLTFNQWGRRKPVTSSSLVGSTMVS